MSETLFEQLDLDNDGELSRAELYEATMRLGWHWREAPFFALLDLFTIQRPISKDEFDRYLNQAANDPLGPYGSVLLNSPHFHSRSVQSDYRKRPQEINSRESPKFENDRPQQKRPINGETTHSFQQIKKKLGSATLARDVSALLILDPQRAFTRGVWMQSIGPGAEADVKPINFAFRQCAKSLIQNYGQMPVMFTRCPFPPDSYQWDDQLAGIIDGNQLYFIKPGNSVLFPPTNGFKEWVKNCIDRGRVNLVMGGCTLNSCVRVSAIETQQYFKHENLQVVVNINLCGARARNFKASMQFGGISAIDSAVEQMLAAGVRVVNGVIWA